MLKNVVNAQAMDRMEKLLKEMQSKAHLSSYQLEVVNGYMNIAHGLGFDEARFTIGRGLNRTKVQQILNGKVVAIHDSMIDASRYVGCSRPTISRCVDGSMKGFNGFKFKIVKQ